MAGNRKITFATITTKGALFPIDFLERLTSGDRNLDGLNAEAYHLTENEKINEAISRSWKNVLGYWKNFQTSKSKLADTDRGTSETREKWLLPLFKELGYGRLLTTEKFSFDGKDYQISHSWNKSPIHLISFRAPLDEKSDIIGARRTSPHAMIQDFLNRSNDHLWAFLSNGYQFRILRDNRSLTKQAYIEFDLETMLDSEVYSDFVILWLLCHQSRVEDERADLCWLEKWTKESREQGIRALDSMRKSVENAIVSLGIGFIENKNNSDLRSKLRDGTLAVQDYYRQLLRIVYRMLFLFTAEDRELFHLPGASLESKEIYIKYYSTSRLREIAQRSRGSSHTDLWELLRFVFEKLGSDEGCKELSLPAWGGFLWKKEVIADLADCKLSNKALLNSIRSLAFTIEEHILRAIDYKNLGAEELGSVYEALLELNPKITLDPAGFSLETLAGSERKTTGSYYTPDSLVQSLLETALEPVLQEALKSKNPEQAILALKFCDPAMGSGHFLIAAAHRTAKKLAAVRTGEDEPSPNALQHALRDVISNCVYGVDINPMAVELCKFSLWLEALEPGMPLSFIDHHIKCGNSLLGVTPALMNDGISNDAFKPIEGDNKNYCSEWKKVNKRERDTQTEDLFRYTDEPWKNLGNLAINITQIIEIPNDSIENIHKKEQKYAELVTSQGYEFGKLFADSWCASFVWKKTQEFPYPITEEVYRKIEKSPHSIPNWMKDEIKRLSLQYQFFHWHLEFPDVFQVPTQSNGFDEKLFNKQTGWISGFSVMLGNPPWERVKLQEKEWFADKRLEIANARNAAERKRMISELEQNDPVLFKTFKEDLRKAEGETQLLCMTNLYPLTGGGDINTYTVFSELSLSLTVLKGMMGIIVPTGIATDDSNKKYFQRLISKNNIICLYDFQNALGLFQNVHRAYKFCLLTVNNYQREATQKSKFAFFLFEVSDLQKPDVIIELSPTDIELINPNTKTCPIFRNKKDAIITLKTYHKFPVLVNESQKSNEWGLTIRRIFDMNKVEVLNNCKEYTDDNYGDEWIEIYESKMMSLYNHRFNTYDNGSTRSVIESELTNRIFEVSPRYITRYDIVIDKTKEFWNRKWLIVWRDVTDNKTVARTINSCIIPFVATDFTLRVGFLHKSVDQICLFLSLMNSFVTDYFARQFIGGLHLSDYITKQLPFATLNQIKEFGKSFYIENIIDLIQQRILELTYTSNKLIMFAQDCGYEGPPFIWDEERRFVMRCELDAFYFHLYEIDRDDVDYIMDTFPIVKRKDEEKYGEYRTKKVILEIYNEMAECKKNGTQYQTKLDPPPADPRVAHKENK